MVARMSLGETRRSSGSLAILSDLPRTNPRLTPPPAITTVAPRPVIAAATPLHRRELGRTSVLAQEDRQGFVKLSAPIKVNQQP
jgi:hypothetical protein